MHSALGRGERLVKGSMLSHIGAMMAANNDELCDHEYEHVRCRSLMADFCGAFLDIGGNPPRW